MGRQIHKINLGNKDNPYRKLSVTPDYLRHTASKRIGLGADVLGAAAAQDLIADALNSPVTTIPVLEHTTLNYDGVLTQTEAVKAFPTELDFFNDPSGAQADQVQSTFVHPGILQSAVAVIAVGFHVFAEPLCFTTIGNAFSPVPSVGVLSPISPDVYSNNATLGGLGLVAGQSLTPANMSWGWPMQYAAWNLIEAYTFEWVVRNRYDLLRESARYIASYGSYGDKVGASSSQVPVIDFARRVNDRYREKGTSSIFLPVDHLRMGLFGFEGAEEDTFRPSADYALAPVTWGGLSLQDHYHNQPYRLLGSPYCIPSSTPLGLKLTVSDTLHQNMLIALMSAAGSVPGAGTGAVPPLLTADQNLIGAGVVGSGPEVSLDTTPVTAPSQNATIRAGYKGGNLSLSMIIKGYEFTDELMQQICSDPALKCQLLNQCGLQIAV